jgi:hypothetical protein
VKLEEPLTAPQLEIRVKIVMLANTGQHLWTQPRAPIVRMVTTRKMQDKLPVYHAYPVNIKMKKDNNLVRNVLKIKSQMPRLQPSVPIAVLGNFHRVVVHNVHHVLLVQQEHRVILVLEVNFVLDPTTKLLFAVIAQKDITKVMNHKRHVYRAFQELIKKILDQQRVHLVAKDSTKVWPVMIPV